MIAAEVVCDSISPVGKRLTTFKLRYPKFIHGEFMTHRVLSRNASSSRAIPTSKLLEEVRSDELRAAPVFWGKNQKGMQAAEELSDEQTLGSVPGAMYSPKWAAQYAWEAAASYAAQQAEKMEKLGVHKQIVNRLLEPFSHINVVATATEWANFFGLRLHKDAQPEMRALAVAAWEVRRTSTPKLLQPGSWHLPFVTEEDETFVAQAFAGMDDCVKALEQTLIKVSVARCARVSYESFETGKRSTVPEDLGLYDRLLKFQPLHASPAEHQATPDNWRIEYDARLALKSANQHGWSRPDEHGNLVGWRQYRKMIPGEAIAPLPEGYS